jgi:hypothetical protein
MARQFNEADWKVLRRLAPVALDRFCQRVLGEVSRIATDSATGSHERYLKLFKWIREQDAELAATFNGLRRSTGLIQLVRMKSLGLVTDEEFAGFSPETREAVAVFLETRER